VFYVLYKNVRDPNENLSPVQLQRKPFFRSKNKNVNENRLSFKMKEEKVKYLKIPQCGFNKSNF
jgi:hypothetical protein